MSVEHPDKCSAGRRLESLLLQHALDAVPVVVKSLFIARCRRYPAAITEPEPNGERRAQAARVGASVSSFFALSTVSVGPCSPI